MNRMGRMPTCKKCGTAYKDGDVICVWCGDLLTKQTEAKPKIETTREKRKTLKKQLNEIIAAHEGGDIGDEEFKMKKRGIAKKISEIKAQKTVSKYKAPPEEPETYKTQKRGGARKDKPSRWWYLTPLIFNIFGGLIAYFAIRKHDYKMARNMIDFGGFMLLVTVVSIVFMPGIISNYRNQGINATETNTTALIENITIEQQVLEKVLINNTLDEACTILGLFSNSTDIQKQDVFSSTYKGKYITWDGSRLAAANKDSEGYILQLEYSLGCEIVARINWDQRAKLLNLGKDSEIAFIARITDFDTAGIIYATDGELIV